MEQNFFDIMTPELLTELSAEALKDIENGDYTIITPSNEKNELFLEIE